MTIEECYEELGGDYKRVLRRLPGRRFVERFLRRYLEDDSAQLLFAALAARDPAESYRCALALKGVAGNLGFEDMERAVSELAETIRGGEITPQALEQTETVRRCHEAAVKILRLYFEA